MGEAASLFKTLLIPALISLLLYFVLSYAVLPLYRRYRGRYGAYIPMGAISSHSSTIRTRIADMLARFLLPSTWREDFNRRRYAENQAFDDDDGEELSEVEEDERDTIRGNAGRMRDMDSRRLSRDLEEGFRDDSEDESDTQVRTVQR